MKKFLKTITIFAVVVFCFAWSLDFFVSYRLRHNDNRLYASWNRVYNDSTNYNVVINGSSRAWVMFNPLIIDTILYVNSYNLGIDGSSVNRQILKFWKYCEMHKIPQYLVQNIDFATMQITKGYEREQFFPYFFFDRNLMLQYDKYENFTIAEKYIPCYRYLGYYDVILEAFFSTNTKYFFEPLYKGYHGEDAVWDGSRLTQMDTVVASCDLAAQREFINFIEKVQRIGTKIIFVYAPIYWEVNEKMNNREALKNMYDSIARTYNIQILDYDNFYLCFDTTYFYNATHLNKLGADIFTTQLAHDIDSIGFIDKNVIQFYEKIRK